MGHPLLCGFELSKQLHVKCCFVQCITLKHGEIYKYIFPDMQNHSKRGLYKLFPINYYFAMASMRRELSRRFKRTRLTSGFCQGQTSQGTSSSHFELLESKLPKEHSIQHGLIALLGCTMMKKRILSSVSHAHRPCITK